MHDTRIRRRGVIALKSLILWLTYNCQYRCSYCDVWRKQGQVEDVVSSDRWVEALNQLDSVTIDLTGGEPSLHPAFYDILEELDRKHTVGVTTNLTALDVNRLPRREMSFTVSLHPSQKQDFKDFLHKAIALKILYRNVTVNYVAHEDQLYLIPDYARIFKNEGLRFHVDPDHNWVQYSPDETQLIKPYLSQDRILGRSEFERYRRYCTAGLEHIHILPDGSAKRCYYRDDPLGNIFTGLELHKTTHTCNPEFCSGCDKDKVKQWRV